MKPPKNIVLIGAGNIGSRHLQGLAKINSPLSIEVFDPSIESLKVAEERFKQIPNHSKHQIIFLTDSRMISTQVDVAIIATSSNIRRKVTEELLTQSEVKNIIFEKLLFQKKNDYDFVERLLEKKNIKAWVNCSMRVTPFYQKLKDKFKGKRIFYLLTGSRFGIATQAIHFIDHMAYLLDDYEFKVDTTGLDKNLLRSKRAGFLELTGTMIVNFSNGSTGVFSDFPEGEAPIVAQISSDNFQATANETTRETFISNYPKWEIKPSPESLLFQSDMTNIVVEDILKTGSCGLPTYQQSIKVHLKLLEELLRFINRNSDKKYSLYPFT
jgi:predicted dehydrogenase